MTTEVFLLLILGEGFLMMLLIFFFFIRCMCKSVILYLS